MDPKDFGTSSIPLHHKPYGPILSEKLIGGNTGKVAVVTGAGRGIGQAIALALASSGANLALIDLSLEAQQQTKAACQNCGDIRVETFQCSVRDVPGVRKVLEAVAVAFGPIDILVNNAGIFNNKMAEDETFEEFWKVVEVNFMGPMLIMYEVLSQMRQRKTGCIINIASRSATVDMLAGLSYNTSKAALARATSSLQAEFDAAGLGEHLQAYSLHPGAVASDMFTETSSLEQQAEQAEIYKDSPQLCGNTVAYIAAGRAKELRGCYFDCRQDIEKVSSFGSTTLKQYGLYNLSVRFIPGYENEP